MKTAAQEASERFTRAAALMLDPTPENIDAALLHGVLGVMSIAKVDAAASERLAEVVREVQRRNGETR